MSRKNKFWFKLVQILKSRSSLMKFGLFSPVNSEFRLSQKSPPSYIKRERRNDLGVGSPLLIYVGAGLSDVRESRPYQSLFLFGHTASEPFSPGQH